MCLVILDPYYPIIGNGGLRYSDGFTFLPKSFYHLFLLFCAQTQTESVTEVDKVQR